MTDIVQGMPIGAAIIIMLVAAVVGAVLVIGLLELIFKIWKIITRK